MRSRRTTGLWMTTVAMAATSALAAAPDATKKTVTVTGCLQGPLATDEYAPSTSAGTPGGPAEPTPLFRLTNATMRPGAGRITIAVAGNQTRLLAEVGHQVRITGVVIDAGASETSSTSSSHPEDLYVGSKGGDPSAIGTAGSGPADGIPTVRAETVRAVAKTCSK